MTCSVFAVPANTLVDRWSLSWRFHFEGDISHIYTAPTTDFNKTRHNGSFEQIARQLHRICVMWYCSTVDDGPGTAL